MTEGALGPVSDGAVGWGILATGGIAHLFTRDLLAHGHKVTAVGSRSLAKARRFAEQFGIPRAYGSYTELVADDGVDVVYVATPPAMHARDATQALRSGKHVLVEKAFALNATEARHVVDLARQESLLVMEAMWTRFLPHMAFVREVVGSGRIGEVRVLHADHTQRLSGDPTHRLNDPHLGGGALLDLGVYPVSFAHDILGPPALVEAEGVLGPTGVDTCLATLMRHGGRAMSTSYASSEARGPNAAVVVGTQGRVEIAPGWLSPTPVTVYDHGNNVIAQFDRPISGRGMQYQATEVEGLIHAGRTESDVMTPEQSVEVMNTLDAVRAIIGVRYPGESQAVKNASSTREVAP